MNYQVMIDNSINQCEIIGGKLGLLNPKHPLLRFDGDGLNDREKDELLDALIRDFGPEGDHGFVPSDEVLYLTFESLRTALETALLIEAAKHGLFRPY